MTAKPCRRCGAMDRLASGRCRPCCLKYGALWRSKNPEKYREHRRQLYLKNLEKERERSKQWRAGNAEWFSEYWKRTKERYREHSRRYQAKRPDRQRAKALGVSEEFVAKFVASRPAGGRICEICLSTDPGPVKGGRMSIDHDHATGALRGMLCLSCNNGLGFFRDAPERLRAAVRYLEAFEQQHGLKIAKEMQ